MSRIGRPIFAHDRDFESRNHFEVAYENHFSIGYLSSIVGNRRLIIDDLS